jgi:putative ABC transport system permease protein
MDLKDLIDLRHSDLLKQNAITRNAETQNAMLRNYLKIAVRNLKRRPGYAFINIAGLAVGIAACLLIGLWVRHELSYDDFHEAADRTHRIVLDLKVRGTEMTGALSPAPMAHTLVRELPEVEAATRFDSPLTVTVQVGDESFVEECVFAADTSFFEMFSFPLVKGNPETALDDEDAVVLTEALAEKYFGDADPMGKTLTLNGGTRRVTGVAEEAPSNSHFQFDIVAADRLSEQQETLWAANNFYTYFRLAEGASVADFEKKLGDIIERRALPQIAEMAGVPVEQLLSGEGARYRYFAQPMTAIHLDSHTDYEIQPNGSRAYVWIFSLVAIFILLIACVNFMNLATARAAERATEVGMRKALGAHRGQLAGQFFGESVLMTAGAFVLALALAQVALPFFNDVAGTDLAVSSLFSGPIRSSVAACSWYICCTSARDCGG